MPNSAVAVHPIIHDKKGTDFIVDTESKVQWDWREMIAQLSRESRDIVFGGCETITGCEFVTRPGKTGPTGLPMWDWVIYRDDGKAISLHPDQKKLNVPAMELDRATPDGPVKGMKFAAYRNILGSTTLKFDY